VAQTWFTKVENVAPRVTIAAPAGATPDGFSLPLLLAWTAVGIPLAWGFTMTVLKAAVLFS
jgi:hypothetical protein